MVVSQRLFDALRAQAHEDQRAKEPAPQAQHQRARGKTSEALRAQQAKEHTSASSSAEGPATTRHVFLESPSGRDECKAIEIDEATFRRAVILRSERVGVGAVRHSALRQGRYVHILQQLREGTQ
jgi:hypothetical protein